MHEGHWGYDHFWNQLGLPGFVVSNVIAGAFYPRSRKAPESAAKRGAAEEPEARAVFRRPQIASLADLTVLVGIVFVMATKATV